jgi:hypothetical protein
MYRYAAPVFVIRNVVTIKHTLVNYMHHQKHGLRDYSCICAFNIIAQFSSSHNHIKFTPTERKLKITRPSVATHPPCHPQEKLTTGEEKIYAAKVFLGGDFENQAVPINKYSWYFHFRIQPFLQWMWMECKTFASSFSHTLALPTRNTHSSAYVWKNI